MACKPDSVQGFRLWMTIPLPHLLPDAVKLPTRASGLKHPCGGLCCRLGLAPLTVADLSTQGPYSALLRVGLAVPVLLPVPRWAFTPPFHLFPAAREANLSNNREVCSLWRFPWGCPRRGLPGTLASWSPDFPRRLAPPRSSSHPRAAGLTPVRRGRQRQSATQGRRPARHRLL